MSTEYSFSVHRRQRGVYLASWLENVNGTEEWDAFATEAAAKRWCAEAVERKRLPWIENRPGLWFADLQIEDGS